MSSLSESEKLGDAEFKWGKKRGVGGKKKEVQFYESFTYDGVEYSLYDCVFMYKEGEAPYIAKLVKIWENGDKSKRVKAHWFFRPSEISHYLRDVEVLENELFFASGEGTGLVNINPLEVIAGKCNVVCISKDNRNPQPSAKEIQMADYVFYRVFDVKSLTISDKMDDKVGGLEVKYVLNRRESVSTLVSSDMDEERNVIACKEVQKLAGKNSTQQLNSVKQGTLLGNSSKIRVTTGIPIKKRSTSGAENVGGDISSGKDEIKVIRSPANEVQIDKAHKDCNVADALADGTALSLKDQDVSDVRSLRLVSGAAAPINGEPESELKNSFECAKNVKLAGNSSSLDVKLSKMKYSLSKETTRSGHSKDAAGLQNESKLNKDLYASQGKLSNSSPSRDISESAHKDSVHAEKDIKLGNLSACRNTPSISNVSPCGETPGPSTTNILPNGTPKSAKSSMDKDFEGSWQAAKLVQSSTTIERPLKTSADLTKKKLIVGHEKSHDIKYKKRASSSCPEEEGSLKKAKFDDSIKQMEASKNDTTKKLKEKNCVGEAKNSPKLPAYENKSKSKLGEAAVKERHNKEKDDKLSSDSLHDPLISRSKGGEKVGFQVIEVTRRPTEKSKWIKLTWEEKMKAAHEDKKLVLLQNLDPEYTSAEVEDIIWNVFKESCTAKMVLGTAISNPHSGQAYVVFRSRDAANRVLQELEDGCLVLPNQRPVVGYLGVLPQLSGKQRSFFGHLSIDKARHKMQRETKDAVATSHYSQNNTVEYEMAMEWCLLQSRSDKWWKFLHRQQMEELEELTPRLVIAPNEH